MVIILELSKIPGTSLPKTVAWSDGVPADSARSAASACASVVSHVSAAEPARAGSVPVAVPHSSTVEPADSSSAPTAISHASTPARESEDSTSVLIHGSVNNMGRSTGKRNTHEESPASRKARHMGYALRAAFGHQINMDDDD